MAASRPSAISFSWLLPRHGAACTPDRAQPSLAAEWNPERRAKHDEAAPHDARRATLRRSRDPRGRPARSPRGGALDGIVEEQPAGEVVVVRERELLRRLAALG